MKSKDGSGKDGDAVSDKRARQQKHERAVDHVENHSDTVPPGGIGAPQPSLGGKHKPGEGAESHAGVALREHTAEEFAAKSSHDDDVVI